MRSVANIVTEKRLNISRKMRTCSQTYTILVAKEIGTFAISKLSLIKTARFDGLYRAIPQSHGMLGVGGIDI